MTHKKWKKIIVNINIGKRKNKVMSVNLLYSQKIKFMERKNTLLMPKLGDFCLVPQHLK